LFLLFLGLFIVSVGSLVLIVQDLVPFLQIIWPVESLAHDSGRRKLDSLAMFVLDKCTTQPRSPIYHVKLHLNERKIVEELVDTIANLPIIPIRTCGRVLDESSWPREMPNIFISRSSEFWPNSSSTRWRSLNV
jgi:hypothetical protein